LDYLTGMKKLSALFSLLRISALFFTERNIFKTAANAKSLLWQITGNGLKQPSYFLGTMHLMCAEDAALSSNAEKIIAQVNAVYLEVDITNAGELLNEMLDTGMKGERSLGDILSAADYNKVKMFFQEHEGNMPFEILEKQPPLLISSTLYELLLPCKQKHGVELKIIEEACKAKKEIKGLETFEFQSSILESIPYEAQAADLVSTIANLEKYRKKLADMIAVYKAQDIDKLYELSVDEETATAAYMDMLLYKRNSNWIAQFQSIAENGSTLFAVGAGHLGGEKGVISLLRQQGYMVRPISNPSAPKLLLGHIY
jgi:uncharacterized protein YbaP (TraB family)